MRRRTRRRIALVVLALSLLALLGTGAPSTSAATSQVAKTGQEERIFAKCINKAQLLRAESWVCTADGLSYSTRGSDGKINRQFLPMSADSAPPGVGPKIDDYDTWCETVARCSRRVNAYIAETKGNVSYGGSSGLIGAFDIIARTNFNGTQPRYRVVLIWDLGPGIIPYEWYKSCRRNITGPDPSCGLIEFYPNNIGPGMGRYRTDHLMNGTPLSRDDDYHDDTGGEFGASGYSLIWSTPALRGRDWVCDTYPNGRRCIFP
jgi:hypothetical protein